MSNFKKSRLLMRTMTLKIEALMSLVSFRDDADIPRRGMEPHFRTTAVDGPAVKIGFDVAGTGCRMQRHRKRFRKLQGHVARGALQRTIGFGLSGDFH